MGSLENQLEEEFANLKISGANQKYVRHYLGLIQGKDTPTYEHSARLAILGARAAECLGPAIDPKTMFFAGALHDIGKIAIEEEILQKTEGFNAEDMKKMEAHPIISYLLLERIDPCSAEIALRHHHHQENGYPSDEEIERLSKLTNGEKVKIEFYSLIFSLLDVYDAATTRKNDKHNGDVLTPEEARLMLIDKNPEMEKEINTLYDGGVLGNGNIILPNSIVAAPARDDLVTSIASMVNGTPQ